MLRALRDCGLLGSDEAARLTPLAGGVSCDVWRVDAAHGRVFAVKRALSQLRVEADWFASPERAQTEVRWLRRVARITPRLVPTVFAEVPTQHLFAMQYLEPASHPVWKDELIAGRIDTDFAASVGRDLARIHAATAQDPTTATDFDTSLNFMALRIAPFLLHVADHDAAAAPRLRALAADLATRRITLVHGDVSPKNILAGPAGPVFLDAECAVHGDAAFDLAFCLTHLLLKSVWLAPHAAAMLSAATALNAAYRASIDWEDPDALSARAAALVGALLLARVDGKSPAPYLDPVQRDLVRRLARARLDEPASDLGSLLASWPMPETVR